jgi:hypothetical protein
VKSLLAIAFLEAIIRDERRNEGVTEKRDVLEVEVDFLRDIRAPDNAIGVSYNDMSDAPSSPSSWLEPGRATFAFRGGDKGAKTCERSSGVLDVVFVVGRPADK